MSIKPGSTVHLVTPDNPRLNGAMAIVQEATEWGAHVLTAAAGSGQFRALYSEMVPYAQVNGTARHDDGYTGDACSNCGSFRMRRSGTCATCEECGSTTGC